MARIIRYTIAGMLGAIAAWAILEPTPLMPDKMVSLSFAASFTIGAVSGLMVGVALGLAEGLSGLSPRGMASCVLMGALVGAGGGVVGMCFGNAVFNIALSLAGGPGIYDALRNQVPGAVAKELPSARPGLLTFLLLLIGRGSGWAFIGGFIGLSQGIATSSTRKMVNGAVGGFIGGLIGGSLFEILVWISLSGAAPMIPGMIRLLTYAATGAAIGLFIGFIEEVAKRAWLVRLVGRNEGKEYAIFKPVTVLGRSELVDVPIFTDPDVAERHATITAQGGRHTIDDLGSFSGTHVNGKAIQKEFLRDGDTITVGKTRFLFRDKATARSGYSAASTYTPAAAIPTAQNVCPFCGAAKDADGNCQCTIGAAASAPGPQATAQMTAQMPAVAPPAPSPGGEGWGEGATARLVATSGPYAGQNFPLKPGETKMGRESTKDIALSMDNTVSRDHARIAQESGVYVLYDDGSTNGTFVNGTRVTRRELANADVVQVGSSKFRFEA